MFSRLTTLLATFALAAPCAAGAWTWPASGPVLRPYDFGGGTYTAEGHRGIDVGGGLGEPVQAPAAGRVSFAGSLPSNGKTLSMRTEDGWTVTLTHLGSIAVSVGDGVAEGETVGTIGPTGDNEVDQPYVHLGIRHTRDSRGYVDPLGLLPPREPAPTPPPAQPVEPAVAVSTPQPVSAPPQPASAAHFAPESHAEAPVVASAPEPDRGRRPVPGPARAGDAAAPNRKRSTTSWGQKAPAARTGRGGQLRRTTARRFPRSRQAVRPAVSSQRTPRFSANTSVARSARPTTGTRAAATDVQTSVASPKPRPAAREVRQRRPPWGLGLAALLGIAGLALVRRADQTSQAADERGEEAPPIMVRDELLPDYTDLLRQLDAAHRPRLHDGRGRRVRAASAAARS